MPTQWAKHKHLFKNKKCDGAFFLFKPNPDGDFVLVRIYCAMYCTAMPCLEIVQNRHGCAVSDNEKYRQEGLNTKISFYHRENAKFCFCLYFLPKFAWKSQNFLVQSTFVVSDFAHFKPGFSRETFIQIYMTPSLTYWAFLRICQKQKECRSSFLSKIVTMQILLKFLKNFYKIREISAFAVKYYLYLCEIYTKILYYNFIFTTHTVQ